MDEPMAGIETEKRDRNKAIRIQKVPVNKNPLS